MTAVIFYNWSLLHCYIDIAMELLFFRGINMISYNKPFKTYPEQIDHLSNKYGLIINNRDFAEKALQVISYYDMINGYQECMMIDNRFIQGTTIEEIYMFYLFDKGFQDIIFRQIMLIEGYFKTTIAYELGNNFGVHKDDYLNNTNFKPDHQKHLYFSTLKNTIANIYSTNTSNPIPQPTKHYVDNHNHIPPWILLKNVSFGQAINLFSLMKTNEKCNIANNLISSNIAMKIKIELIINSLNILRKFRNQIAHNLKFVTYKVDKNQLYYSHLSKVVPRFMLTYNDFYKKKMGGNDLYCVINLILYFLSTKDSYLADSFCNNLLKHITPLSNHQNEQIKLELFKSYSNITNLPNDLGNRILAFKKHLT